MHQSQINEVFVRVFIKFEVSEGKRCWLPFQQFSGRSQLPTYLALLDGNLVSAVVPCHVCGLYHNISPISSYSIDTKTRNVISLFSRLS